MRLLGWGSCEGSAIRVLEGKGDVLGAVVVVWSAPPFYPSTHGFPLSRE